MKKILSFLLLSALCFSAGAQSIGSARSVVRVLGSLRIDSTGRADTSSFKPLGITSAGLVGRVPYWPSGGDGNNYLGSPTFNTATRTLTLPRTGLSSVSVVIPDSVGAGGGDLDIEALPTASALNDGDYVAIDQGDSLRKLTIAEFSARVLSGMYAEALLLNNAYNDSVDATADEIEANNTLIRDLVNAGLLQSNKVLAFYPFQGNSIKKRFRNMLDPRDTDEAFRLTDSTGVSIDAKGLAFNHSASASVNTHILPEDIGGWPYVGASYYVHNGAGRVLGTNTHTFNLIQHEAGIAYLSMGMGNPGDTALMPVAPTGHVIIQRPVNTRIDLYAEGVKLAEAHSLWTQSHPVGTPISISSGYAETNTLSCLAILSQPLSPSEVAAYNAAVQKWINALERQKN